MKTHFSVNLMPATLTALDTVQRLTGGITAAAAVRLALHQTATLLVRETQGYKLVMLKDGEPPIHLVGFTSLQTENTPPPKRSLAEGDEDVK